jgi:hypothetical protein
MHSLGSPQPHTQTASSRRISCRFLISRRTSLHGGARVFLLRARILANGSLLPSASYRLMRPILLPCNKRRRVLFSLSFSVISGCLREGRALFLLSQFGLTRNSLLVSMGRKRPPASLVSELAQQRFADGGRRGIFEKQFLFQHKVFNSISNCLFFP